MVTRAAGDGQANGLFKNAVESIQLGVEDYQIEDDPKRAVSAVRNFYAGVLLLAKEVLARKASEADLEDVIHASYKPVSDGNGGVAFKPASRKTIGFATIRTRFKDFGLPIKLFKLSVLNDLNAVRNDLEHYYSDKPREQVREVIARSFPLVSSLLRSINEAPKEVLGDNWQVMLDVKDVYDQELKACRKTFEKVEWYAKFFSDAELVCLQCQSRLVEQIDPANADHENLICRCNLCGNRFSAKEATECVLETRFQWESYVATTDGGDQPLHTCPECHSKTYLVTDANIGCAWCGFVLGRCTLCSNELTPETVSLDTSLCTGCENLMSEDD